MAYDWPGNIRELENVIERAVVLADGPALTIDDLPPDVRQPGRRRLRPRIAVAAGPLDGDNVAAGSSVAPGSTSSPARSQTRADRVDRNLSRTKAVKNGMPSTWLSNDSGCSTP